MPHRTQPRRHASHPKGEKDRDAAEDGERAPTTEGRVRHATDEEPERRGKTRCLRRGDAWRAERDETRRER